MAHEQSDNYVNRCIDNIPFRNTNIIINIKKHLQFITLFSIFLALCITNIYLSTIVLNSSYTIKNIQNNISETNSKLRSIKSGFDYKLGNNILDINKNISLLNSTLISTYPLIEKNNELIKLAHSITNNLNIFANVSNDKFNNISLFMTLFENHKNRLGRDIDNIKGTINSHNIRHNTIATNLTNIMTNLTNIMNVVKSNYIKYKNRTHLLFKQLTINNNATRQIINITNNKLHSTINTLGVRNKEFMEQKISMLNSTHHDRMYELKMFYSKLKNKTDMIDKDINILKKTRGEYKLYLDHCPKGMKEYGNIKPLYICY